MVALTAHGQPGHDVRHQRVLRVDLQERLERERGRLDVVARPAVVLEACKVHRRAAGLGVGGQRLQDPARLGAFAVALAVPYLDVWRAAFTVWPAADSAYSM